MQKKSIILPLSLFLISFVSASFHYSYGRFSFRGFIDSFDPATLTLGLLFFIFLLLLNNLVFINLFRGQKAPSFVVSASISLLSVYWMYQKGWYLDQSLIFPILIASVTFGIISLILVKGFRINRALSAIIAGVISGVAAFVIYDSGLGISSDILLLIISLLLIGGLIIAIWKFGFSLSLIIIGLALLMTTFFTDIFYEEGLVALIGFILLVIGLLLAWRNRGRGPGGTGSGQPGVIRRGSRWFGRGANTVGGRIVRGTIGRTKLTKGRFMSKKRAEEAAYREEAIREEKIRKKISDNRRLEAEMENARREKESREEETRQISMQQEQLRKQQREREKIQIKANKEEARREKAQQKQLEKEQEKRGKIEIEAHQEEAARRKAEELQKQKGLKKAKKQAYKEEARRQKGIEEQKRMKEEMTEAKGVEENKLALARKLGIDKLQKQYQNLYQEFQEGLQNAGDLSSQATSLGWTKSGRTNPREDETEGQYKSRVKEANKTYKAWYRQYSKNISDDKRLKEIQARIQHLQGKI